MDRQNLTLLTDLYELTMMQGYFKNKDQNETVIFDAFYRNNPCDGGFAIMAGLEQLIQYIKELHFEQEDIDYLARKKGKKPKKMSFFDIIGKIFLIIIC